MKSLALLISIFLLRMSAQINCNYTINPTYSFFSNGVVNYTNNTTSNQSVYVCGYKTTVYDTLPASGTICREVYLEKNTIYYFKGSCPSFHNIYGRTNSKVIVLPGTSTTAYLYEPGAVIIYPTQVSVIVNTCTVLDFGINDCLLSGIASPGIDNSVKIFPNPVSDQLRVTSSGINSYRITNEFGQTILEEQLRTISDSFNINTSSLDPGLYFLHLNTQFGLVTKKFIEAK